MVNGINSSGIIQNNFQTSAGSTLTDEQKKTLQDIISKYDPDNMTDESTKAMLDEIKAAGIKPGKEFGEIMNTAGFKPPEKPQGPPPADESTSLKVPEYIASFLEKQESGTATEEDIISLIQNLLTSNKSTTGSIVDTKA